MSDEDNAKPNVPFALKEPEADDIVSSVGPDGVDSSGELQISPSGRFRPIREETVRAHKAKLADLRIEGPLDQRVQEVRKLPYQIGNSRGQLKLRDPKVSRLHAQLLKRGRSLEIEPLSSACPVFLRIADELKLEDGDEIIMGLHYFVFRSTWAPEPSALMLGVDPPGFPRLIRYFSNGDIAGVYLLDKPLMVGRSSGEIMLEDESVSAAHATLEPRGSEVFLQDLQSEKGTFIRVHDPVELLDGDCFLVGQTSIFVEYP